MIDLQRRHAVVRIYLPYVSSVIESLGELKRVEKDTPIRDVRYLFYMAHQALHDFLFGSVWAGCLRVCVSPGKVLMEKIKANSEKDDDAVVDWYTAFDVSQAIDRFKTVLEAEFQTAGVYLVTAKRGYDVATLLESAEMIFPPEVNEKLPQIQSDLREAGKCIAFNLGTAAGFHLLRALEVVVCAYWYVVMDGAPLPENRNLGNYINEMAAGDHPERKKVLLALRQVKDAHRNSIMHPEETLNIDQAIALLNTVQSAIVLMLPCVDGDKGRSLMEDSAKSVEDAYESNADALRATALEARKAKKQTASKKRLVQGES